MKTNISIFILLLLILQNCSTPLATQAIETEVKHSKIFYKNNGYTAIDILYATDRKKEQKPTEDLEDFYTGLRGDLQYGVAVVTIPHTHTFGEMERPIKYFESENLHKHITVQDIEVLSKQDFLQILKSKLSNVTENDILIFIHGFNNTFADAIRRTAQLTYDLKFKGVPLTYSWPSNGKGIDSYMQDEASVQYTTPHLVTFFSEVIKNKGDANIHIIAHSMGNRALTNALKELSFIYPNQKLFKNVILAAPDVDQDVFKVSLLPYIKKTTEMITLYASSDDKALKLSSTLHNGMRLGQSDNIFVFQGLNTIDASGIDTSALGHSYFAEKEIIVKDLKEVILKSLPPQQRKQTLVKKTKNDFIYWKIKD